jgi:hypothetical protein
MNPTPAVIIPMKYGIRKMTTPVYINIISTTRNTLFDTVGLLAAFLQKILRHKVLLLHSKNVLSCKTPSRSAIVRR